MSDRAPSRRTKTGVSEVRARASSRPVSPSISRRRDSLGPITSGDQERCFTRPLWADRLAAATAVARCTQLPCPFASRRSKGCKASTKDSSQQTSFLLSGFDVAAFFRNQRCPVCSNNRAGTRNRDFPEGPASAVPQMFHTPAVPRTSHSRYTIASRTAEATQASHPSAQEANNDDSLSTSFLTLPTDCRMLSIFVSITKPGKIGNATHQKKGRSIRLHCSLLCKDFSFTTLEQRLNAWGVMSRSKACSSDRESAEPRRVRQCLDCVGSTREEAGNSRPSESTTGHPRISTGQAYLSG